LTEAELAEIARRRDEARARALEQLNEMSAEEDASIAAAAESDPDARPLTDADWARMRPAHEVHPELVAALLRRRGRPKADTPKRQVTLRLDADVIDRLRASGAGWQTRLNQALRDWLERSAPR
jgi:uncharacterized protein (DUF4415 family)